jgi:hypothetical protein
MMVPTSLPPPEMSAQVGKRCGKCTCQPERVVLVAGCCSVVCGAGSVVGPAGGGRDGLIGRAAAGVEVAGELRLCPMRAAACGYSCT